MPLVRWNPMFDPFGEWEKMLEDFQKGKPAGFTPAVDIYEKGDEMVVEMQVVGMDAKNVDVSVQDDVLIVQGKTAKQSEVDEKNYYRKEIHQGSFYRSVPLPAHVDGDKAKAKYEDGVLKVFVPKRKEVEAKKVKIEIKKHKSNK